ncbi:MAG: alpha/beta hydrolase fold domain-containing protein [Chthoniobacterales bacterium]
MRRETRRWVRVLLLMAAVFCCSASLLVWISAPTAALWVFAIVVGEWGHFAALAAVILAAVAWRLGPRPAAALALVAAVNFLSPTLQAMWIARTLPARCTAAFSTSTGPPSGRVKPFSLPALFLGVPLPEVEISELTYGMDGRKPLKLDLYQPVHPSAPLPLIVMVHGGSWNVGNKEQLSAINRYLAGENYTVAAINYRHAPKEPFPSAVEDVFRAIDFLKGHAVEAHLDTTRIVLMGRSAGGQIALSAAYSGKVPEVRGVVALYAPADLVLGYEKPSRRWVLDSKKVLEDYLGGTRTEKPQTYAAASPINFVGAGTPSTLLIHGSLDPIVWPLQSENLAARLQEAGRPHLYLPLPWATHGCDANLSGPSGQLTLYAIDRLLAAAFAPASAEP